MNLVKHKCINLEKNYLYLPMICRENMKKANFKLQDGITSIEDKHVLEQIASKDRIVSKSMQKLHYEKKKILKKILIENKKIPSSWKVKANFADYIENAFKDESVLNSFTQHIKNAVDKRIYDYKVEIERYRSQIPIQPPLFNPKNNYNWHNLKKKLNIKPKNGEVKSESISYKDYSNLNTFGHTIIEEEKTTFLVTQNKFRENNKGKDIGNPKPLFKSFSLPLVR